MILLVQMPSYPEGVSYEQLRARRDRFLEHMDGKARQHLNLFSPRAAERLFAQLGFTALDFVPAIFDYDLYLVASRQALKHHDSEAQAAALTATPGGRLGLALIDLAAQHEVCEADRAERLKVIHCLDAADVLPRRTGLPRATKSSDSELPWGNPLTRPSQGCCAACRAVSCR